MSWFSLPDLAAYFSAQATLWAVLVSSFLASTILPFSSEAVLLATLRLHPHLLWPALCLATLGNTLGGLISYGMGRGIHRQIDTQKLAQKIAPYLPWFQRYGCAMLLFAWLPIVGDGLCLFAGWLGLPILPCGLYMAVGRFARYALLVSAVSWLI